MTRLRIILLAIVALVIGSVCIRLGFWQLDRLTERRAENARVRTGLAGATVGMDAIGSDSTQSRAQRVNLRGTYDFDNEVALINRSRDGAPGVNILTPLRVAGSDTAVIVNRGWVYSPDGATIDLAQWREAPEAIGTAYVSWIHAALANGAVSDADSARDVGARRGSTGTVPGDSSARRVRRLERSAIATLLPYPIAPYQLVLIDETIEAQAAGSSDAGSGLFGAAAIDSTRPIRISLPALDEGPHKSYAVQWFAFAAIALIGTGAVVWKDWSRRTPDALL